MSMARYSQRPVNYLVDWQSRQQAHSDPIVANGWFIAAHRCLGLGRRDRKGSIAEELGIPVLT